MPPEQVQKIQIGPLLSDNRKAQRPPYALKAKGCSKWLKRKIRTRLRSRRRRRGPSFTSFHQLQVYLVGGQTFTINEVTDSPNMPNNVVAFINAWRQKRDEWHSPNNDPKFGVRVKDVSLYEYRVGTPAPKADDAKKAPKPVKKVAADK